MRECKAEEVSADQMEIRRLRHELDGLTSAGVVECMARNPAVFECISDLERDLAAAQEARQAAEARAEQNEADARRYRYLRSRDKDEVFDNDGVKAGVWIDCTAEDGTLQLLTFDDADAAIDAAIRRGE